MVGLFGVGSAPGATVTRTKKIGTKHFAQMDISESWQSNVSVASFLDRKVALQCVTAILVGKPLAVTPAM
jgi:hypothetical protein